MRSRHLPLLLLATLLLAGGVALAVVLGVELAGCYLPGVPLPDRPICGGGIWGFVAAPSVLLAACAVVVAAGALGAGRTGVNQFRGADRFRRRLLEAPVCRDSRVAALSQRMGVQATVVADDHPLAVTVGFARPRVLLTTGLVALLDDAELEAVLHHEGWHVARRHPAVYALVRAAAEAVVLFPVIGVWANRIVLRAEMDADTAAVNAVGLRTFASALLKLAEGSDPLATEGAAYGSVRGMIHDRIRALSGETPSPTFDRRELWLSAAGLLLAALPAVAMAVAAVRSGR